ncbi:hypothetical protein [Methylobacter psychrophilus]|nr:hypothetical protein [Methylobacter psychrophilus]
MDSIHSAEKYLISASAVTAEDRMMTFTQTVDSVIMNCLVNNK